MQNFMAKDHASVNIHFHCTPVTFIKSGLVRISLHAYTGRIAKAAINPAPGILAGTAGICAKAVDGKGKEGQQKEGVR